MADRPIIFSAPMVRALLDGRKTQTRRLLRISRHRSISEFGPSDTKGYDWHFRDVGMRWHDLRHAELMKRLPYAIGDRLWVREAFCYQQWHNQYIDIDYVADPGSPYLTYRTPPAGAKIKLGDRYKGPRYPSIHMPRWASRLTLTVTDVRVQRLREISRADAIAEGIRPCRQGGWMADNEDTSAPEPEEAFRALWLSLHGPGSWEANPWVVALTFTVERRNIDA